jgi:hypothetical protein
MVVSQAKLEANRRDAARSTGPRTESGKNKSKFNALDHGCRAKTLVLQTRIRMRWRRGRPPGGGQRTGPKALQRAKGQGQRTLQRQPFPGVRFRRGALTR